MKAPVWALIARIDLTGSSSGDHRYMLVDNLHPAFQRLVAAWIQGLQPVGIWMFDRLQSVCSPSRERGPVSVWLLISRFSAGASGRLGRPGKRWQGDRGREWLLWCLGSALFSVVVAHFGINYPAMMEIGLFTLWTIISVATFEVKRPAEAKVEIPDDSHLVPDLVGAS